MTRKRKRAIKLLMAAGYTRNQAADFVEEWRILRQHYLEQQNRPH